MNNTTPTLDDGTVIPNYKSINIWVSVMCAVPSKDVDEDEAPLEGIRKMNLMIKSLINKIPLVKLGLWNPAAVSKNIFLKELPEDVDVVEKYAFDFNRFLSPGKNVYCRLNLYYNLKKISISEIESVIAGFKKPRVQHMSLSHSDAISPIQMGTFTGSVKAMAESPDFTKSFQKFFKLKISDCGGPILNRNSRGQKIQKNGCCIMNWINPTSMMIKTMQSFPTSVKIHPWSTAIFWNSYERSSYIHSVSG